MLENLSGATRLVPIIGDPIAQVKSPNGVTRMLEERGQDLICIPVHATPADFPGVMAAMEAIRNVHGIIVTVPHKFSATQCCGSVTERARFLGAVNVMRRTPDGRFRGDMCDGVGFVAAQRDAGFDFKGRRGLLVGAGGAGTAIAEATMAAGLAEVAVLDPDTSRRDDLIGRLRAKGWRGTPGTPDARGFDIVMHATPLGMRETDPLPIDIATLAAGTHVGDAVTMPEVTPLIAAARKAGCRTQTGIAMFGRVRDLMVDFLLGVERAGG